MRLAHQHIIRMAAVLALATASTSALAQSAEYRRGYEDGYAAGQRGDRGDRGDRGRGQWGNVRVEEAQYGARRGMCDARQAVRREVERNGSVMAGNHLCGDPAFNEEKRLTVVYRCGNDAPVRVTARENETLRMSCRR